MTTIRFDVESGDRPRRRCPVELRTPWLAGRWKLTREDRERPIPCQPAGAGRSSRVVWIIDSMARGELKRFELTLGERQRLPSPRVTIRPEGVALRLFCLEDQVAELILSPDAAPTCALMAAHDRVVTLSLVASIDRAAAGSDSTMTHRMLGTPVLAEGPVFAEVVADYVVVDADRVPLWKERHAWRLYDGDASDWLFDYRVTWSATTGPIVLVAREGGVGFLPRLDCRFLRAGEWVSAVGQSGTSAIHDHAAPFASWVGVDQSIAIVSYPHLFGHCPTWRCRAADGALCIEPSLARARTLVDRASVPLGSAIELGFRFAAARGSAPAEFAASLYADLDAPPTLTPRSIVT